MYLRSRNVCKVVRELFLSFPPLWITQKPLCLEDQDTLVFLNSCGIDPNLPLKVLN